MGILAKLFGTDEAIKKAGDAVINAGDALVFTKEEKAHHFLDLLKAYEPFKLAQRLLALTFSIPYVLIWLVSAILFLVGALVPPQHSVDPDVLSYSDHLIEVSKHLAAMNNETLGLPVALILGFYFGGGAIESFSRTRKAKKED